MIHLLYHIKRFLRRYYIVGRVDIIFEKIILIFYTLFQKKEMGVSNRNLKRKVIVSLTTIPSRVDKVWITIESLLRQTYKPSEIILWLAEDEFSNILLPSKLLDQKKRGLTIRYCKNVKSYKKFYYAALENPQPYIIIVDDHTIYSEFMLKQMLKDYYLNPGVVICNRSHMIQNRGKTILPYHRWGAYEKRKDISEEPSFYNFFTGCGGVLLPVFLMDKHLLDKKAFMKLAPSADDIWLNLIAWVSGLKIKNTVGVLGEIISIRSSSIHGLFNENKKKNDEQLNNVIKYLGIDINDYLK